MPTFETAEAVCFAEKREIWRSHGPVNGWRHSADRYVLAKLGAMSVDKVGSAAPDRACGHPRRFAAGSATAVTGSTR